MVIGLAGGSDAKFAGSPYPGIELGKAVGAPHQPITEGLVSPDTLWSCTTVITSYSIHYTKLYEDMMH